MSCRKNPIYNSPSARFRKLGREGEGNTSKSYTVVSHEDSGQARDWRRDDDDDDDDELV